MKTVLLLLCMLSLTGCQAVRVGQDIQLRSAIVDTRESLDSFPSELEGFKRIYWGELPLQATQILNPSESYVAWYTTPDNKLVNIIMLYWEPEENEDVEGGKRPVSPDQAFREAGWKQEKKFDVPEGLKTNQEIVYARIYSKDHLRQTVLFWYNEDPKESKKQPRYSVGIYVTEQGTLEEDIQFTTNFAHELRKHLEPFGLMIPQETEAP